MHKKKDKKKGFGWGTAAVAMGGFLALIGLKAGGGTTPPPPPPPTGIEVKIWFRNVNENATTYLTSTNYSDTTPTLSSITSATSENEIRMPVRLRTETIYYIYASGDGNSALAQCQIGTDADNIGGTIYDPGNTQDFNVFVNDVNSGWRTAVIEKLVPATGFTLLASIRFAPAITANIGASAF